MEFIGACWKCDNCGSIDNQQPWNCIICNKETCENCFSMYMLCYDCGKELKETEAKQISEEAGYTWD